MKLISTPIRLGRYSVRPDADVQFTVQRRMGGSSSFKVVNVSSGGLAAMNTASEFGRTGLAVGEIVPWSRMRFLDCDLAVGRVVCRYIHANGGHVLCGFSFIDFTIPLDGPLSGLLSGYVPASDGQDAADSASDRRPRSHRVRDAVARTAVDAAGEERSRSQMPDPGQSLAERHGDPRAGLFIPVHPQPDNRQYPERTGPRPRPAAAGSFLSSSLADVHRHAVARNPEWPSASLDLTFTCGDTTLKLVSARQGHGSMATPPGGLDLELMWLGIGSSADFVGRDVRGRAVLIQDVPMPDGRRRGAALEDSIRRAFEEGAAAVGIIVGIADTVAIWQRVEGGPGFSLGTEDGRVLRDLIGTGQSVRMKYRIEQ